MKLFLWEERETIPLGQWYSTRDFLPPPCITVALDGELVEEGYVLYMCFGLIVGKHLEEAFTHCINVAEMSFREIAELLDT